jgi:hypothetical protein
MKKALFLSLVLAVGLGFFANGAWAYTIYDAPNDGIGSGNGFESYGINVLNYTPGVYSGAISFQLFTDYPLGGVTVGAWQTQAADLFIKETYYGQDYLWAIPLVNHGNFTAGTMYAVGTYKVSNDFEPLGGGYTYNPNIMVWIDTIGTNYGQTQFGGGTVTWNGIGTNPNWQVDLITGGLFQDDPNGVFCLTWGTSTCANDVVQGCVPIPGAMVLLGAGMVRLAAYSRRKRAMA